MTGLHALPSLLHTRSMHGVSSSMRDTRHDHTSEGSFGEFRGDGDAIYSHAPQSREPPMPADWPEACMQVIKGLEMLKTRFQPALWVAIQYAASTQTKATAFTDRTQRTGNLR